MEAWVTRADGALPTVPRWNANKMPLSNRVAQEINAFRRELRGASRPGRKRWPPWIADRLDCGKANAEIILGVHRAQHEISEKQYVAAVQFVCPGRQHPVTGSASGIGTTSASVNR